MTASIIGIPTTRVSDLYIRQRMLGQVQFDQAEMSRIQTQLTTGHKFGAPSENPVAAMQVMGLQSLLQRKDQIKTNLSDNQTFLSATDSALSNIADTLASARSVGLGAIGATASDSARNAAVAQIDQAIQQLVSTGNQQFRGRYLFAGSNTAVKPFSLGDRNSVVYSGNSQQLSSYADIDQLFTTNLNGSDVFGAISQQVQGAELTPALTYSTRLADLRQGAGISLGSIAISDGHSTSIVDLSKAETIGDVAAQIRAHPPEGRAINVEITAKELRLQLVPDPAHFNPAGDNLSVREVGSGTTATELGILNVNGAGSGQLVGQALDPAVRLTTSLGDILGTRATAFVHSGGTDNDLIMEAKPGGNNPASLLNGVQISFVDDPAVTAGNETVDYTAGPGGRGGTLVVHIQAGHSRAIQVRDAINNDLTLPFTAKLDPLDDVNDGQGMVDVTATATTDGGGGSEFDRSGLQISNGGKTYTIGLSAARTVEDLLNAINGSGASVLAEINQQGTGLNIRSRLSGGNFMIGENGGTTAESLGLRTFTKQTLLTDLNFGSGVDQSVQPAFTITRSDDTVLSINLSGATTINDVLDAINSNSDNTGVHTVLARLAPEGNGIQLVEASPVAGKHLTVTRNPSSAAAADLGLVDRGTDNKPADSKQSSTDPDSGAEILGGADVRPLETDSMFNSLVRLRDALQANNMAAAQRAMGLVDGAMTKLSFTRAELGTRQQGLDTMQSRLDAEEVDLKQVMSDNYDADLAEVISNLTSRQTAYQASLQAAGKILQMTLLNYL
jgi:flagellin-like hook-associated protein FlgL